MGLEIAKFLTCSRVFSEKLKFRELICYKVDIKFIYYLFCDSAFKLFVALVYTVIFIFTLNICFLISKCHDN